MSLSDRGPQSEEESLDSIKNTHSSTHTVLSHNQSFYRLIVIYRMGMTDCEVGQGNKYHYTYRLTALHGDYLS